MRRTAFVCIICNMPGDSYEEMSGNLQKADVFLSSFRQAGDAMRDASHAMLTVSKVDKLDADSRKRYDRTHKRMVELTREWNRLEQMREA